ncbi:hypothetical protein PTTG_27039, partial [Puccinia triticina 1-1 BBBD Race 1]
MLQKLPTNHHPDEIPKTLLNKWHINSNLCSLTNDNMDASGLTKSELERGGTMTIQLKKPLFLKWKQVVKKSGRTRKLMQTSGGQRDLLRTVQVVHSVCVNRKMFTTMQRHEGNSFVEFFLGDCQRF